MVGISPAVVRSRISGKYDIFPKLQSLGNACEPLNCIILAPENISAHGAPYFINIMVPPLGFWGWPPLNSRFGEAGRTAIYPMQSCQNLPSIVWKEEE